MTENQEKELFKTLATLVTGVQAIQTDVKEIKEVVERLDAKTDSIAGTVMSHETRLTNAEKNIEELQGGVH